MHTHNKETELEKIACIGIYYKYKQIYQVILKYRVIIIRKL